MKKFILFSFLLFGSMLSLSQEVCTDKIYTDDRNHIIFDCCILDVKRGNIVIYSKDEQTDSIAAVGISKDGHYVDLHLSSQKLPGNSESIGENVNHNKKPDFDYSGATYQKAKTLTGFGIVFTFLGVGLEVTGFIIKADNNATENVIRVGNNFIYSGLICLGIGIPLWISGALWSTKIKQDTNRANQINSLSLGVNNNGLGLTYRF